MTRIIYRPIVTWPRARTKHPKYDQFRSTLNQTNDLLLSEAAWLNVKGDVVVQLAVREFDVRQDGQFRSGFKAPEHPGVIVAFTAVLDGRATPLSYACDTYTQWQANVRAVALALEALRAIARYGVGAGHEQYVGFQALGSGIPMPAAAEPMDDWTAAAILIEYGEWGGTPADPDDLIADLPDRDEVINAYWREAVKRHHPDVGGDDEIIRKVNAARDHLLRT